MKLTNPFEYKKLEQITHSNGTRVYDVGEIIPLPSVTTILSASRSLESIEGIKTWRENIGAEEADRITNQSITLGNAMHDNLEQHVLTLGESKHQGAPLAKMMTDLVVKKGLCNVDEVWGTEAQLYYPEIYAGTTDAVGIWSGRPAIIDYKNSRKEKKEEWIDDYFMQLVAYSEAHNKLHSTNIKTGVVMMATHNMVYQEFVLEGAKFEKYRKMWWSKVHAYYKNI